MKKVLSLVLFSLMLLCASCALGENMGIQIIGGPGVDTEPVSLDDFKLNTEVKIDGYGRITGTSFAFSNYIASYYEGSHEIDFYGRENHYIRSGNEAEYAVLRMDIVNTALTPKNFLEDCSVKVIFDDTYTFAGWTYQSNYNNGINDHSVFGNDANKQNMNWVINKADQFAIDPMYKGHYVFGCTLPNAVVEGDESLTMIITIDGHEITYNIRK